MKRWWLAAWLGWLGAGAALGGYVEDRGGQTVIHIRTDVLPDPSDPSTAAQAESAAVAEFKRQFPRLFAEKYRARYEADPEKYGRYNWSNVVVELERFSGLKVEGAEVDLLAIAGGVAPDVLYINFRKSDNYIRNNFLYPLDKPEDGYLSAMSQEEIDFRINPKLWPVIQRKGPGGTEHVWAIPWGGALGKVLLFRKDLFDAKGVPHPTVQWTWDDLLAAARKLTDPKRGVYGFLLTRSKQESYYWVSFLWSAGGEVMEYDAATDTWRCVFGSREAAQALDFYTRLGAEKWVDADGVIRRGYCTKDAGETFTKWERGEIGMALSYIDERLFSTINPELTGMVPVPLGPGGQRGGELNSRMMGLYAGIREPAVRDAAWEYMRFYDSEEAVRIKTRYLVEGGFGPFLNPKYLRQFGYPEIERLSPPGWVETFDIAIATGRPEPYGRNSNVAYDLMTVPLERAEQLAIRDQLPEDPQARLAVLEDLLNQAEDRANEVMMGLVPARERQLRRAAAVAVLIALVGDHLRPGVPPRAARLCPGGATRPGPARAVGFPQICLGLRAAAARGADRAGVAVPAAGPGRGHGLFRLPVDRPLHLGGGGQLRRPAVRQLLVERGVELRALQPAGDLPDLPAAGHPGHPAAGGPARATAVPAPLLPARRGDRPGDHPALEAIL